MTTDPPLAAFLADRDVSCPVCRYNLRALRVPACPECAAPLHLSVASPSLHLGPYLVTIVSFALAAGFDLVVAIIAATLTLVFADPAAPASWIGPALLASILGAAGAACLGSILWLARHRTWWHRLGPRRQRRAAAVTFLLVGATHAALGLAIFSIMD